MQNIESSDPVAPRRKLSLTGQILASGLGLVFFLALLLVSPTEMANKWCPASSFYTRGFHLGSSFAPSVFLALCFPALTGLLLSRLDLSVLSNVSAPPGPRWRYFTPVLCLLACGSALSVHLYIRSVSYYYCLTSDEIVVQTGYVDGYHSYTWDDVKEVHGQCWTNNLKGGPFLGGSINLLLPSGPELSINLLDKRGTAGMVKDALRGKNYRYFVNSTVTPDACPHEIYRLLWDWPNDGG
jgi:hypothetical protein